MFLKGRTVKNILKSTGILIMLVFTLAATSIPAFAEDFTLYLKEDSEKLSDKVSISTVPESDCANVIMRLDPHFLKSGKTSFTVKKSALKKIRKAAGCKDLNCELRTEVNVPFDVQAVSIDYNTAIASSGSRLYLMESYANGDRFLTDGVSGKVRDGGFYLSFNGDKSRASCYVMVKAAEAKKREDAIFDSISLPEEITLKEGDTKKLELKGIYKNVEIKKVRFTSSASRKAKVTKEGNVTGRKRGSANVRTIVILSTGRKKIFTTRIKIS